MSSALLPNSRRTFAALVLLVLAMACEQPQATFNFQMESCIDGAQSMQFQVTSSSCGDVPSIVATSNNVADAAIDNLQREIEERSVLTIARRQPMAVDLREIVSALRIANDLERIGDLAKNIAKRVNAVGQTATPRQLAHSIETMAALVLDQVNGVVETYVARDAEGLKPLA
jgi:Na+/phosphate symporter